MRMESIGFQQRKERVLQARVKAAQKAQNRGMQRLRAVSVALLATLACFFLLKAATLAYFGAENFAAFSPQSSETSGWLHLWLAGPDPITTFLASVISGQA